MEAASKKPKTINFTVDEKPVTTSEKEMSAGEILKLAGFDPESNNLVEVKGKREREEYEDNEPVKLREGKIFVTAYTGQTPIS